MIQTTSTFKSGSEKNNELVKVEFQGAGGEVFELQGTVSGNSSLLLCVQGNKFTFPASLKGNGVLYRVHKPVALGDILSKFHMFPLHPLAFFSLWIPMLLSSVVQFDVIK